MALQTVVIDVEAVPNEPAMQRLAAMRPERIDGEAGVPRWILHRIVAASVLVIAESRDRPAMCLHSYTSNRYREHDIVAELEAYVHGAHTLLTFNGAAYDLPLLRARAMAHRSLTVPHIGALVGTRSAKHVDLALTLAGGQAASRPSLTEVAAILDLPAKRETAGTSVPALAAAGDYARLARHCESDVLTTWLGWLHSWVADRGAIDEYLSRLRMAEPWLRAEAEHRPHLAAFADACARMERLDPADPLPPVREDDLTF